MLLCQLIYSYMTHFILFLIALHKLHNKQSNSLSLIYSVQQTAAGFSFGFFKEAILCPTNWFLPNSTTPQKSKWEERPSEYFLFPTKANSVLAYSK